MILKSFVANLLEYMYNKNYRNRACFDKIIAKIKWCNFLTHSVCMSVCMYVCIHVYTLCLKKTSPMFLAITRESIDGFS